MFHGTVVFGEGKGKLLGYPTANLSILPEDTKLDEGVYAAWAHVGNDRYQAAVAIDYFTKKVEAHLLNAQEQSLYGQEISIDVVEKVSEMIRFKRQQDLQQKIARDVDMIKNILQSLELEA